MVRCNCGSNTCACSIIASAVDGIEVLGAGSVANPYRLRNLRGNVGAQLEVVDSPSVDLTLEPVSVGDPNSTFRLSAAVTLAMSQLTDVDHADVPATNDVVTWDGTKWIFAPVASAANPLPPGGTTGQALVKNSAADRDVKWATIAAGGGAVVPGFGLKGDGSAATPLYTDQNQSPPVGNLASLITLYPPGLSISSIAGSTAGLPEAVSGTLVTFRSNNPDTAGLQIYSRNNGKSQIAAYMRQSSVDGWSAWVPWAGDAAGMPWAQAAGSVSAGSVAANAGTSVAVTFPSGRFSLAPNVVASGDSNGFGFGMATSATATGFTARYYNPTASVPVGPRIVWSAVQMNSFNASG